MDGFPRSESPNFEGAPNFQVKHVSFPGFFGDGFKYFLEFSPRMFVGNDSQLFTCADFSNGLVGEKPNHQLVMNWLSRMDFSGKEKNPPYLYLANISLVNLCLVGIGRGNNYYQDFFVV